MDDVGVIIWSYWIHGTLFFPDLCLRVKLLIIRKLFCNQKPSTLQKIYFTFIVLMLRLLTILLAFDILEAQELSYESLLPRRLYGPWSLLDIRDSIVLRIKNCPGSRPTHCRHIHCSDTLRLSNKVWFHLMDAIPFRRLVGFVAFRLHGCFLPP